MTLNKVDDLETTSNCLEFRVISQIWEATTAKRMKTSPYCGYGYYHNRKSHIYDLLSGPHIFAIGPSYTHCCRALTYASAISCYFRMQHSRARAVCRRSV